MIELALDILTLDPAMQMRAAGIDAGTVIDYAEAMERAIEAHRPMRILYISDFDPRGHNMPTGLARKMEFLLRDGDLDLDITLDPIVLTPAQIEQYRLPRKPFEKGGATKFERQFGEGGTELDALEALYPGELAQIIEREVFRYIDPTLSGRCTSAYWTIERRLKVVSQNVREPYEGEFEDIETRAVDIKTKLQDAIDEARNELDALEQDASELWDRVVPLLEAEAVEIDPAEIPQPRPATPPESPLYDSKRSYIEQLDHYRARQGKGGDE